MAPWWICTDRRLPPDSAMEFCSRPGSPVTPLGVWVMGRSEGLETAEGRATNKVDSKSASASAQSTLAPGTVHMGAMRCYGWPRECSTNGTHQANAPLACSNVSDLMPIRDIKHSVAQRSTLWVIEEHVGSCEVRSWIVGPGLFPHGWNRPSKRRRSPFAKTRTDADRLWPLES